MSTPSSESKHIQLVEAPIRKRFQEGEIPHSVGIFHLNALNSRRKRVWTVDGYEMPQIWDRLMHVVPHSFLYLGVY